MILKNIEVRAMRAGANKAPLGKNGYKDATFEFVPEEGGMYSIACEEARTLDGKEVQLVVIDVDNKERALDFWETLIVGIKFSEEDLNTFTVRSQGGGLHYYYTVDMPYQFPPTMMKNVDIKSKGGSIIGPNSVGERGTYTVINDVDIKPLPISLFEFIQNAKQEKSYKDTPMDEEYVLTDDEKRSIVEGLIEHRDWDTDYDSRFSVLARMKGSGFNFEDFMEVINDSPSGKNFSDWRTSWESSTAEPNVVDISIISRMAKVKIAGVYKGGVELMAREHNKKVMEELYETFSHLNKVEVGNKIRVMDRKKVGASEGTSFSLLDYKSAKEKYTDDKYLVEYYDVDDIGKVITKKTKTKKVLRNGFDLWFKNPPIIYEKIQPDAETNSELVYDGNSPTFNDYKIPTLIDGEGTYDMFFDHLYNNVCRKNDEAFEFLKRWIFYLVKYPNSKNGIILALRGAPGSGKTIVFKILSGFFDKKYTNVINNVSSLSSNFNSTYASSYLISLEEAMFAGTKKNGIWGKIKEMATGEWIYLEMKGIEAIRQKNRLHFMITTNNDWATPKEVGDRRYFVLDVGDDRANDREYFQEMMWQMENGGYKKLRDYIFNEADIQREGENWDIPITEAGIEDMVSSSGQTVNLLARLYEEYHEDYSSVSEIFKRTTKGGLFIQPIALYDSYKSVGLGIDRGRKEVKKILKDNYKKAVMEKGKDGVYGYVFDDIEDYKDTIVREGFGGISPFKEEKQVDSEEEIIVNTIENLLY